MILYNKQRTKKAELLLGMLVFVIEREGDRCVFEMPQTGNVYITDGLYIKGIIEKSNNRGINSPKGTVKIIKHETKLNPKDSGQAHNRKSWKLRLLKRGSKLLGVQENSEGKAIANLKENTGDD